MYIEDIKNDSFDDSRLEELQPHLEEIEELRAENNENDEGVFGTLFSEDNNEIVPEPFESEKVDSLTVASEDESDFIGLFSEEVENENVQDTQKVEVNDEISTIPESVESEIENIELADEIDNTENANENAVESSNVSPAGNVVLTSVPNVATTINSSEVNISANSIKVSAPKVVVDGGENKEEEIYTPSDFSHINSHKGGIELAEDEHVIREYRISGDGGKAIVTSQRLILDCDSRIDLPIENVGGVASSHCNEVKVVKLVFGLLFIGICLFACLFDFTTLIPNKDWAIYTIMGVGAAFGLVGVLMVAFSFKKKFFLNVFGQGLTPIVSLSSKQKVAQNNLFGIAINARRGKDFAKFTGEIGALLLQIKSDLKRKK